MNARQEALRVKERLTHADDIGITREDILEQELLKAYNAGVESVLNTVPDAPGEP